MRSASALTFLGLLLLSSPFVLAQKREAIQGDEVSLYVTVTNARGEWIGGLTADNFKVREGKSDYELSSFSSEETPVTVGILIDTSGSSVTYLGKIAEAMSYFIKASKQETEMFVMVFNTRHDVLVEPTSDRDHLMKALLALKVTPKGNTALFDSIEAGLDKLSKSKHAKRALIVFSDAQENASKLSFDDLRKKVRGSNALLYNVNVQDPADASSQLAQKSMDWIDQLTTLTGGRSMYAIKPGELFQLSYRTGEELRYQYRIGFRPSLGASKPHEWRKIGVKLNVAPAVKSRIGEMRIRAREGYYSDSTAVN